MITKRESIMHMMIGLGTILLLIERCLAANGMGEPLSLLAIPILAGGFGYSYAWWEGKKSAYKLLLPYGVFGLLSIVATVSWQLLHFKEIYKDIVIKKAIHLVTGNGEGDLWLLCAIPLALFIYQGLRKRMKMVGTIIVIAVAVVCAYFMQKIGPLAMEETTGFRQIFLLFALFAWKSLSLLPFLLAGEWSRIIAEKHEKKLGKRILFGLIFLLLSILLCIVFYQWETPKEKFGYAVSLETLVLGIPGLVNVVGVFSVMGCGLLLGWLGKASILSFVGENAVVPIATFTAIYVIKVAQICARQIFLKFDHNFMTAVTWILVTICIEGTGMLLYQGIRKHFSKKK